MQNADIDLKGSLDQPASWDGTINANVQNVRQGNFALDDVKLDAVAHDGKATIREARIDAGTNHIALRGTIDLPKTSGRLRAHAGEFPGLDRRARSETAHRFSQSAGDRRAAGRMAR